MSDELAEFAGGIEEERTSSPLDMIKRVIFYRKKIMFISFIILAPSLLFVGLKIPKKYKASTTILVIPQKISSEYVKETLPDKLTERLPNIMQEIMSRSRIIQVLKKLDLLKDKQDQEALENEIARVQKMINLEVNQGSSFQITCTGREPKFIKDIANTTASIFIEETLKRNSQQAQNTTVFLDDELISVREKLEEQEKLVSSFKKEHMGELPQQQEAILRSLDRLQIQLQTATLHIPEAERQRKLLLSMRAEQLAAINAELKKNEEDIPLELQDKKELSPDKRELLLLKENLKDLKTRYSDAWPEVVRVKKKIFDIEAKIEKAKTEDEKDIKKSDNKTKKTDKLSQKNQLALKEIDNSLAVIELRLSRLKEKQNSDKKEFEDLEKKLQNIPAREIELTKITRDYEIIRSNYQDLLGKKMNAELSENLITRQQGERFTILDFATLPSKPYMPTKVMIFGGSFGISLALSIALGFLLDLTDPTILTVSSAKEEIPYPIIGEIPHIRKRDLSPAVKKQGRKKIKEYYTSKLITYLDPYSPVLEEYRNLRACVLGKLDKKNCNLIAVSSSTMDEGKSLTVANLAITISQGVHESVLIIDCDMRKPTINKLFKVESSPGLSEYLSGKADIQSLFKRTEFNKISVIPSGKPVLLSSELLSSNKMKELIQDVKNRYEKRYIIFDMPPILPLSDILNISNKIDGTLLVVNAANTSKVVIKKALDKYKEGNIIGVVFNNYKAMSLECPEIYKSYYKEKS